ncbi:phenylalanine--tRNA ligase subunit beta [Candidatus Margulisiibacteriota bacterium]
MKISLAWLKEFVKIEVSPKKLADKLTMAGTEVSAIEYHGKDISNVVVGKIKHLERHPGKEDVLVCQIDTGGKLLQVITKAANLKVGDKVPIALDGATLPGEIKVEKRELHGIESFGMLCSTVELGMSSEATGVMVLDKESALGEDIRKVIGVGGTVLEADILPNRPDCLSMQGIAREISAVFNKPFKPLKVKVKEGKGSVSKKIKISVRNKKACPRYMARVIDGVKIKDSPKWLQSRLTACGIRPINTIVDVTNYVLLELGQPMHAFDLDKIAGGTIIVRNARKDEKIKTLDGDDRHLSADTLVIADSKNAVAVAGVMGGVGSSVTPSTKAILLESAYFDPMTIHKAERKLKLRTESSIRFEKGVDWDGVGKALDRAAQLIADICGGNVLKGKIDVKEGDRKPKKISLRVNRVNSLLGTDLDGKTIKNLLARLGFKIKSKGANSLIVEVPLFRAADVEREIDVIEEVARIYGYNEISSTLPKVYVASDDFNYKEKALKDIKQLLVNYGLNEAQTYSMVGKTELEGIGWQDDSLLIPILNAISPDMNVMRPTLLTGIIKAIKYNQSRQIKDVSLFETGKIYLKGKEGFIEKNMLTGGMVGQVYQTYEGKKEAVDFHYLKNLVKEMLALLHIGYKLERSKNPVFHPGRSVDIKIAGKYVGSFGEIHPDIASYYELKGDCVFLELDLDGLLGSNGAVPRFKGIPRYPSVKRDIAMLVPKGVENKAIIKLISEVGRPLVEKIQLFDRYAGHQVKEGYYSLAYSISYIDPERTLTDEEVNKKQAEIVGALADSLRIEVRKQ